MNNISMNDDIRYIVVSEIDGEHYFIGRDGKNLSIFADSSKALKAVDMETAEGIKSLYTPCANEKVTIHPVVVKYEVRDDNNG
jgi:hypothetical protein